MVCHINRLANDLSILKQIELNHHHVNFVICLIGSGPCYVFQTIWRISNLKVVKFHIATDIFCHYSP
ncbi:Uncharacterised protein [Klebsiella oxytoca]|nr:Uncharacterised protein [Klebsiella oxytoca]